MADYDPDEISAELAKRGAGAKAKCPLCKGSDWVLDDAGFAQLDHRPDPAVFGGSFASVVVMACRQCGFLAMHSAVVLGLTDSAKGASEG